MYISITLISEILTVQFTLHPEGVVGQVRPVLHRAGGIVLREPAGRG